MDVLVDVLAWLLLVVVSVAAVCLFRCVGYVMERRRVERDIRKSRRETYFRQWLR